MNHAEHGTEAAATPGSAYSVILSSWVLVSACLADVDDELLRLLQLRNGGLPVLVGIRYWLDWHA